MAHTSCVLPPCFPVYVVQMADKDQAIAICVNAFRKGNRLVARRLLSRISQPATVTTRFRLDRIVGTMAEVSLLHLAAYWGWEDVVTELVSVHGCSIDCKDRLQHIPLHYMPRPEVILI